MRENRLRCLGQCFKEGRYRGSSVVKGIYVERKIRRGRSKERWENVIK